MTTLLDFLHSLGAWSLDALWLPVLAWTLAALPALALLRWWTPHPLVGYRVRQALLLALPLGLALAAATDWTLPLLPAAAPATAGVVLAPSVVGAPAPPAAPALPSLTWMHALGLLTLVAGLLAAGRLARLAVSAFRLARFRRSLSSDVPAGAKAAATEAARRLGVGRRFRLAQTLAGAAPMTLSLFRPVIALPPDLSGERLQMALAHELVHLRRRDDRAAWGEALVAAVFFAHPLCTLLRRQIAARREQATDSALLERSAFSPHRYARLLYDLAAAPHAALVLSLASPNSSLKKRLDAMKAYAAPAPRSALLLAVLTLALPLLLMACTDLSAPTEADTAPPAPAQANAMPDSVLTHSIASIDVRKGDEPMIRVRVKPGTSQEIRDQLRRQIEDSEVAARVVITEVPADGSAEAASGETEHAENSPVPTLDDELSAFIQSVDVRKAGRGHVYLTLKPGTPESVREQIREQLLDTPDDGPKFTVEIAEAPAPSAPGETPRGPQAGAPQVRVAPAASDTTELSEVDEKPEIIGGPQALYKAIQYPEAARADSLEGTAYVQFVVDEEGAVRDAEVLRGPAESLNEAALRAVRSLTFRPAKKDGKPVVVQMAQPIRFQL